VDLLPTFVGCIALPAIEAEVRRKIAALHGVDGVDVASRFDPPWTVDRISAAGRESLRNHGVTVPGVELRCPFCNSENVRLDSPFGPARCRMIYYCDACRNVFEHMKQIPSGGTAIQLGRISSEPHTS
jgi:ring-1,2-phenylacetyl-CoA epoxidase subunit PaaD